MTRTTQIFVASTLYGVMNLAAAIDSGQFGGLDRDQPRGYGGDRVRRVLVISNNAQLPEISPSAADMDGFDLLAKRFDQVISYNAAITPFHPSSWSPRPIDTPLFQRYLRQLWDLADDDLHLVVESLQVNPAQAICRIFADARIDVYADGLMSYGPTRNAIDPLIGTRIERLLYADLVSGLDPLLLGEWNPTHAIIPTEAIRRTVSEIATSAGRNGPSDLAEDEPVAMLLGQFLSALGIVSHEEEEELHRRMLIGAITNGHRKVIFKPHPSAPRELADSLRSEAERRGTKLWVITDASLAETLYARLNVEAVFGCFSTAMITAAAFYRIPVYAVGSRMILDRLTPYHNSNRIPVTIVDALVPRAEAGAASGRTDHPTIDIADLVAAVSYVMQPELQAGRREQAQQFLEKHYPEKYFYFRRHRLTKLDLPGALLPPTPRPRPRRKEWRARARVRIRRLLSQERVVRLRRRLPVVILRRPSQD
jgi:hypothetical protein